MTPPERRARIGRAARRASSVRLEWPELRGEILAQGGIGPSPDFQASDWRELGLYRERGKAPDLVAAETMLGRSDRTPWQGTEETTGDSDAMLQYLRRSREEYQDATPQEREASKYPLRPSGLARRRAAHAFRSSARIREFGTADPHVSEEQREHAGRIRRFVIAARARRQAEREARYEDPAVGFYTDENDEVHPITHRRMSPGVRARLARGARAAARS